MVQHTKKVSSMLLTGIAVLVSGLLLLTSGYFTEPYDTGALTKAYPYWCTYMDITDDKELIAVNDSNVMVYCIDPEDESVKYILDERDFKVNNAYAAEVCFDEEKSLYVHVVEQGENFRGNLSDRILRFDSEGNFSKEYVVSEEPGAKEYKTRFGMKVCGGYISFVEEHEKDYSIVRLDAETGAKETLAVFPLTYNSSIVSANYDDGSFLVTLNDGRILEAGTDGSEKLIHRFNFEINNSAEDNVYASNFVHAGDEYYFLDEKFYDAIYSYKDGIYEKVYTLSELLGWDEKLEEEDYREYHRMIVDNAFSCLRAHNDILEFSSNSNLFIAENGKLEALYASDEGLRLPLKYAAAAVYAEASLAAGIALVVLGILIILVYTIRYRFTVLNKTIVLLVPTVIMAFSLITVVIVEKVENIYLDNFNEKMIAVSSLVASGLDKELILELDNLDDIQNGNVEKLRSELKEMIDDHTDWSTFLTFEISEYDESQCNYLLTSYPQDEEIYLNTYFLQTLEDLEEHRIGDSNTYALKTSNKAYYYVDAITVIYDGDKPIALVDVYGYLDKMNEQIASIQRSIILIAALFTLAIVALLVFIARYITGGLKHTSKVIKQISSGNLNARVEKITKDELGIVGEGINNMAAQLKLLFETQDEFSKQVIETLVGTVDAKDKYTNGHSLRVAKYSKAIAEKLGKTEEEQNNIYYAGLLHDIGKIGVPDEIINKPARLNDLEYAVIKTHPEIGHDLLKNLSNMEHIAVGAYGHHERYDGKGYPQGLKGEEIPEIARIIGVADAYDAMTSNRSYRKALSKEKVRKEIEEGRGTQFDPVFADIMLEIDESCGYEFYE
ncbi:MAG: HD domain-containing phosphohydrolase [Anaerovoracaceae bacterium]